MSNPATNPIEDVSQRAFFGELLSDPNEAQFVHDVINGQKPKTPRDETLRLIYGIAVFKVLAGPPGKREGLIKLVEAAYASGYSDEDYAAADYR